MAVGILHRPGPRVTLFPGARRGGAQAGPTRPLRPEEAPASARFGLDAPAAPLEALLLLSAEDLARVEEGLARQAQADATRVLALPSVAAPTSHPAVAGDARAPATESALAQGAGLVLLHGPGQDGGTAQTASEAAASEPEARGSAGVPAAVLACAPRTSLQAGARPGTFRPLAERGGHMPTGVARLDSLLGGGYPAGSAVMLHGPPFCGKQQLQYSSVCEAARQGIPVTYILHTVSAGTMSERLRTVDPAFAEAERNGLVTYIDAYSQFLGEPTDHPCATYVDDPADLGKLLGSFDDAWDGEGGVDAAKGSTMQAASGLVAIESVSTLLVDMGPSKTFAFLRTVLGRTIHAGGVALLAVESNMHSEAEVQMAKHLCTGMVELMKKGEGYFLHVEGLETSFARPGWVEYQFNARSFKLRGSFSAKTIK